MTMRPVYYTFTPADEDPNGFADDVTAAAGVAFTLLLAATPDGLAHKVVITPSGSVTGNYTISGIDADGVSTSETLATDTANAVTSVKFYASALVVLAPAGLGAETVDIGWADEFASQTIPLELYTDQPITAQVTLTGTANFDIEDTLSDIRASSSPPPAQATYTWLNDGGFTGKTASLAAQLALTAIRAVRLVVNSYSAGAVLALALTTPR